MFNELYQKSLNLAAHKSSKVFLAIVSFMESSFFPIPPDVMIVPIVIAKKKDYLKIFLIALLFSYSMFYFTKNFSGIMKNTNNFVVNKPNDFTMITFFNNLKIDKNFNRIYLSPNTYKLLDKNNSAYVDIMAIRR